MGVTGALELTPPVVAAAVWAGQVCRVGLRVSDGTRPLGH